MKMMAGATLRASPNSSRTRLAPTPTIISMNSDALALKNGTLASPAVARASSVLPVPGGPASSTPFGRARPEAPVLVRVLEKVDDLVDLRLDLVDAGDVVERHANGLGVDPPLLAAAHDPAHRALLPPQHPDPEPEQQQQRRERHEQVHEEAALLHQRLRAHGRPAGGQLGEQIVLRERRTFGGELLVALVLGAAGERRVLLERTFDRLAAREHLGDVAGVNLALELRVRHGVGL